MRSVTQKQKQKQELENRAESAYRAMVQAGKKNNDTEFKIQFREYSYCKNQLQTFLNSKKTLKAYSLPVNPRL